MVERVISGERMMIAQVLLLMKGNDVPRHSHLNEPPNLPHSALALEDTVDVDVFSPPREDRLNKTDAYLRKDG